MKPYDWKTRLVSWDDELFRMVESLTEKKCEPLNGGDHYFFEADYEKHNTPEFILALWDAIEGRLGERLAGIDDDPERHVLIVTAYFPKVQNAGKCLESHTPPEPAAGNPYYAKIDDYNNILAVQVEPRNTEQLLEFVGDGKIRIDAKTGEMTMEFRNACGSVFVDAKQHDYIVYREPGRFEVVPRETFERNFCR